MKNPIAGFDSGHSSHAAFLCRLDVDSSSVRWALTNTEIKSKFYCNWCDRGECPWHRTCIRIFLYCRIGESSWRMRTQFRSKDSMKTKRIGPDGEHDPSWPVAKKERDWYTCDNSVDRDKRFNTRISFFQNKNVVDLLVKWNEASTWVEKKIRLLRKTVVAKQGKCQNWLRTLSVTCVFDRMKLSISLCNASSTRIPSMRTTCK